MTGRTLRILQVLDKGPQDGGVAVHVAQLARGLTRAGHQVDMLRLSDSEEACEGGTQRLHRMPQSYGVVAGVALRARLGAILRDSDPDLIHVHECFTTLSPVLLAQMRAAAPVVGTLHDTRPFCYLMTRRFGPTGELCARRCGAGCFTSGCVRPRGGVDVVRLARRWAMDHQALRQWRRLDRVIVPSAYLGDLALQHGIPETALRVVAHGTEAPALAPQSPEVPPLILYVGGLFDYKGVHTLLDSLVLVGDSPWQAAFIGEGPARPALQERIAAAGLGSRVRLEGHISNREALNGLLARARMLVVPSVVPESFSMVGIEALAVGTPVVSFGLGGVSAWLRDGENGLLAADRDSRDLARQMGKLLADEALSRRLGDRGREMVARGFTASQALERLIGIYGEVQNPPLRSGLETRNL